MSTRIWFRVVYLLSFIFCGDSFFWSQWLVRRRVPPPSSFHLEQAKGRQENQEGALPLPLALPRQSS